MRLECGTSRKASVGNILKRYLRGCLFLSCYRCYCERPRKPVVTTVYWILLSAYYSVYVFKQTSFILCTLISTSYYGSQSFARRQRFRIYSNNERRRQDDVLMAKKMGIAKAQHTIVCIALYIGLSARHN